MKKNNRKRLNLYIQGQRFAARASLIVWLFISCSLEGVLADPRQGGAIVKTNKTALGSFWGRLGTIATFGALLLGESGSFKISEDTVAGRQLENIQLGHPVEAGNSRSLASCNYTSLVPTLGDEDLAQEVYTDLMDRTSRKYQNACRDFPLLGYQGISRASFSYVAETIGDLIEACKANYEEGRDLFLAITYQQSSLLYEISIIDKNVTSEWIRPEERHQCPQDPPNGCNYDLLIAPLGTKTLARQVYNSVKDKIFKNTGGDCPTLNLSDYVDRLSMTEFIDIAKAIKAIIEACELNDEKDRDLFLAITHDDWIDGTLYEISIIDKNVTSKWIGLGERHECPQDSILPNIS